MDINSLLNGVDCDCGRHHTCDIEYVYIQENAISRLTAICKPYNRILLVADENTFAVAGEKTKACLNDKEISEVIFSGSKLLIPNEEAVNTVTSKLNNTDLIIGIGSGVVQDICKYVSFKNKLPYLIVATAPSMDGYASDGAAMILNGMKVTVKAGLPKAIIADTDVLANAPFNMIRAGYGDIIGKFSALNDWKLSSCVNGEYFCEYIYNLTLEQVNKTLSLAEQIKNRDKQGVKALMEALVVIGILMSFAGSSRPASGSEHHLAHFFEITGILNNTQYLPHGIDVAYSTIITAALREKILADAFPKSTFRLEFNEYQAKVKAIYGEIADECIKLQQKVGNLNKNRTSVYIDKESEVREILSIMPKSFEIKAMLQPLNFDFNHFMSYYGEEKINNAVIWSKELKDRYTVLWMNFDFYGNVSYY